MTTTSYGKGGIEKSLFRYKDVNPEGKVPALATEGQILAESLVIIEYINDRFPEAK